MFPRVWIFIYFKKFSILFCSICMCWFLSPQTLLNALKCFFIFFITWLIAMPFTRSIQLTSVLLLLRKKLIQKTRPLNVQQSFHDILKNLYITYREKDLLIADLFFCFHSYRVQQLKRRLDWIYTRSNRAKAWVAYGLFHLSWFSF